MLFGDIPFIKDVYLNGKYKKNPLKNKGHILSVKLTFRRIKHYIMLTFKQNGMG